MRINKYNIMLSAESRIPYLVKEESCNYKEVTSVSSPEEVKKVFEKMFNLSKQADEHLVMLTLGGNGKLLGVFELSHGSMDCSWLDPRTIMTRLFMTNATSFILAHNHPSGVPIPSKQDINATERLYQAAKIMGYNFMDHMIAGTEDVYYSMRCSEKTSCWK